MNSQISENTIETHNQISKGGLSTEVLSTDEEFEQIANEWNELVEVVDVDIFQTFEWQRTWWKYFGGNNLLHIVLFRKGSQLVGIMPLFIDFFMYGEIRSIDALE